MGAVYVGRGHESTQWRKYDGTASNLTNLPAVANHIRGHGFLALDSSAFHYSVYRYMVRFLGVSGQDPEPFDVPDGFVNAWKQILVSNDLVNANTGQFDPRHMYGTANQDTFRWPAITLGRERNLLGLFITTLLLPGIPLLLWGEEQGIYTLDNTASNYMYGRQPVSAAPAWQMHGCYSLPETLYTQMDLEPTRQACHDEFVSWDHRDPSHPMRNIVKHFYHLRQDLPVVRDGLLLEQLSNHTVMLPTLDGQQGELATGLFSVVRYYQQGRHNPENSTAPVPVWFVFSNRNTTWTYEFNALIKKRRSSRLSVLGCKSKT